MKSPNRIYWDACTWLGLLNQEPDKLSDVELIYQKAEQGKVTLCTSAYTLIECNRFADEEGKPKPLSEEGTMKLTIFFLKPFIQIIPLNTNIAHSALNLWRTEAKMRKDVIHVASALVHNIEMMHTYDNEDLLSRSREFHCKNGNPLIIEVPRGDALKGLVFESDE